jgi:hypothetical protein
MNGADIVPVQVDNRNTTCPKRSFFFIFSCTPPVPSRLRGHVCKIVFAQVYFIILVLRYRDWPVNISTQSYHVVVIVAVTGMIMIYGAFTFLLIGRLKEHFAAGIVRTRRVFELILRIKAIKPT